MADAPPAIHWACRCASCFFRDTPRLLDESTGDLFAGDAAMNAIISRAKHTIWIDDVELYGKSWDAMLAVHPMRILPSHGNPFSPALLAKYRHFMEGGKVIPMKARKEKEPRG